MNDLLLKENQAICGREKRPIYEAIKPRGEKAAEGNGFASRVPEKWAWKDISEGKAKALIEAAKKKKTYHAKVGQADALNGNYRVYPKAVWQDQLNTFTPKVLADGNLAGATDHPGYFDGGSLKETCILWQSLEMESDGSITADFVVISDHSAGSDLQSQLDSQLNVGFSTFGYGTAHEPGDAERKEYGLGENDYAVIMNRDYRLTKIDAVDDPSVADARIQRDSRQSPADPSNTPESKEPGRTGNPVQKDNSTMKTLAELKAAHPELFGLHESAISTAVATAVEEATTPLKKQNKALVDAVNVLLPALKSVEGISLPEREVLPSETAQRIETLQGELKASKAETVAASQEKASMQTKLDAAAAEKSDIDRQAKTKAKLETVLKDEQYAKIAPAISKAGESKLADKSFTEATVEDFVKEKAAEYAALPMNLKTGTSGSAAEGQDEDEEEIDSAAEGTGDDDLDAAVESLSKAVAKPKK